MASTGIHALVAGALAAASPWEAPSNASSRRSREAVIWVAGVEGLSGFPRWVELERPLDEPDPEEPVLVEEESQAPVPVPDPRLDPEPVADVDPLREIPLDRTFARPAPQPRTRTSEDRVRASESEAAAAPPTTEPLLIHCPAPRYPRNAQRLGWQGTVLCRITVRPDGSVERVVVMKSCGHRILDDAAVEALLLWCFRPGSRGGFPETREVLHRVSFRLPEG